MSITGNICRICLLGGQPNSGLVLVNIYKKDERDSEFSIIEALQSICGLKISAEDDYPKLICCPCRTRLKEAHNLRQLSQRSHETLTNILIKVRALKDEPDDIADDSNQLLEDPEDDHASASTRETLQIADVAATSSLQIDCDNALNDTSASNVLNAEMHNEFVIVNVEDGITIVESVTARSSPVNPEETLDIDDDNQSAIVQIKSEVTTEDILFLDPEESNSYTFKTDGDSSAAKIKKEEITIEDTVVGSSATVQRLVCCGCDKAFSTEMKLRKHALRKHRPEKIVDPPKRKFPCMVCYRFFSGSDLTAHKVGRNNVQPLKKCKFCGCKFVNFQALEKHCNTFHTDELYKCCSCNFPAVTHVALTVHANAHRRENREIFANSEETGYQCSICFARFKTLKEKWMHERFPYRKLKNPKNDTETVDPSITMAICCKCPKVFETTLDLRVHQTRLHKPHRDVTGKNPFECDECFSRFPTVERLDEHKHKDRIDKAHYACGKCSVALRSLKDLSEHLKQHQHLNMLQTKRHKNRPLYDPVSCLTCGKVFKNRESLNAHIRRYHKVGKGFPCNSCSQSFRSKQELVSHEILHSGKYPHPCDICQRGFRQISLLIQHYERHTSVEEKLFQCQHCVERFSKADFLAHHVKYRHRNLKHSA